MDRRSQRGEGRLGFLISLAVVGLAVFLGVKVIPVRINAYNFRDLLRDEVRMAAVRKDNEALAKRILEHASDLEIPLKRRDLTIKRSKRRISIHARYEIPIDLKVTTYVYRFDAREEAPLF